MPLQTIPVDALLIVAVGSTIIVDVAVLPVHATLLVKVGVTVTVAVTTPVPPLTAVNEFIVPLPLVANPILAVLFVHG